MNEHDYDWPTPDDFPFTPQKTQKRHEHACPSEPLEHGLITSNQIEDCDLDLLVRQLQF